MPEKLERITLIATRGSIVDKCLAAMPDMNGDLEKRLRLLEEYDMGFLLSGMSPRRLLRDGQLFANEQVIPLLLHFGQWDRHCRFWASKAMRQWLVFKPSEGNIEGVNDEKATSFCDYFFKNYAIPLIEEFRQFVALCMLYPDQSNAPSGPIDMIWHDFILYTEEYADFSQRIWLGNAPPEV